MSGWLPAEQVSNGCPQRLRDLQQRAELRVMPADLQPRYIAVRDIRPAGQRLLGQAALGSQPLNCPRQLLAHGS